MLALRAQLARVGETRVPNNLDYPDEILNDVQDELESLELALRPTPAQLAELVKLAFFGSLLREENSPVTFALAFLSRDNLHLGTPPGNFWWSPAVFEKPRPASIDEIAKLAPALDHREGAIMICPRGGELEIVGIVRTSLSTYRTERVERSSGPDPQFPYVRVTASDAGVLSFGVHAYVFKVFAGGKLASKPIWVLTEQGVVRDMLMQRATEMLNRLNQGSVRPLPLSSALGLYCQVILRLLQALVDATHGGTIAILSNSEPVQSCKYGVNSEDLQRVIAAAWQLPHPNDNPPPYIDSVWSLTQTMAMDAIRATARLAAVDGALILGPQFQLLGFGAQFDLNEEARCLRAKDAPALSTTPQDMKHFGMRHRSAASFAWGRPGAVVFVRSEDGPVSCMTRPTESEHVLLWRPVALTWIDLSRMRRELAGVP
jgi:hypothetical protein